MANTKQQLGERGERAVHDHVPCPRCTRSKHLTRLPPNFQCADVICKFCGFLAQVKATTLAEGVRTFPDRVLGGAWKPQHEQIIAGIFHSLFIVGFGPRMRLIRIDYVPSHVLQVTPSVFEPRKPLSPTAKRAGWTGFVYDLSKLPPVGVNNVYLEQ